MFALKLGKLFQAHTNVIGSGVELISPALEQTDEEFLCRVFNLTDVCHVRSKCPPRMFFKEIRQVLEEMVVISFEVAARRLIELVFDRLMYAISTASGYTYEDVNRFFRIFHQVIGLDSKLADLMTEENRKTSIGLEHNVLQWWHLLYAAYRANFYFTTVADPAAAVDQADLILNKAREEHTWNNMFSHGVHHLLLKRSWSVMFDKNIQTVLGFLALMNSLSPQDKQVSEWIKMCPVLFIHYIRVQALREQNKSIFGVVLLMVQHLHMCYVDRGTNEHCIGTLVVCSASAANNIKLNRYRRTYLRRFSNLDASRDLMRHADFEFISGLIQLI